MQLVKSAAVALVLAACVSTAWGAVAYVAVYHGEWASGTTYDVAIAPVSGNALCVFVPILDNGSNGDLFVSIADGVNTYTPVATSTFTSSGGLFFSARTYYVKNVSGTPTRATVTITNGTLVADAFIGIVEWSGVHLTAPLDGGWINHQNNPGTGADAVTSTATVTTANGDAICGFTRTDRGGTINLTAGTGYVSAYSITGSPEATMVATQVQSSAGSIAATMTSDVSDASTDWFTGIVALKAAAGAASSSRSRGRIF